MASGLNARGSLSNLQFRRVIPNFRVTNSLIPGSLPLKFYFGGCGCGANFCVLKFFSLLTFILGAQCLGHSNWIICSLLSQFCSEMFPTFDFHTLEANFFIPQVEEKLEKPHSCVGVEFRGLVSGVGVEFRGKTEMR